MASTCGAAARASSTDASPATWTTCTSRMPGSARRMSAYAPRSRRSQSWITLVPQRRCCTTISSASWLQVRRNVAMGGGTAAAISAMRSHGITPGPLGISETRPSADAPASMARRASSTEAMQQTLIRTPPSYLPSRLLHRPHLGDGVRLRVLDLRRHDLLHGALDLLHRLQHRVRPHRHQRLFAPGHGVAELAELLVAHQPARLREHLRFLLADVVLDELAQHFRLRGELRRLHRRSL